MPPHVEDRPSHLCVKLIFLNILPTQRVEIFVLIVPILFSLMLNNVNVIFDCIWNKILTEAVLKWFFITIWSHVI